LLFCCWSLFLCWPSSCTRPSTLNSTCPDPLSPFKSCSRIHFNYTIMPPATSARVVRRAPFSERVKSLLNLWDIHLWLSEELNSRDWEEFDRRWSTSLGIALNLLFIFLRANSTPSSNGDDIFEDYDRKPSGLFASFVCIIRN
jgi:hypothetical protein